MTAQWNDDSGDWQGLASAPQRPRYVEIARVVGEVCPGGAVLDVGCGEGVLANYLPPPLRCTGIEPSAKAAAVAARTLDCQQSTGEEFDARGQSWDCIVFNEMLYYSPEPRALLEKFTKLLTPRGVFVISIYQKREPWRARLTGKITNAKATRIVRSMAREAGWKVLSESEIPQAGAEPWWILAARPVP